MASRAKNQPVFTSVYWLTSSKLPPWFEMALVICASKPTASGQLSLRIETIRQSKPAARKLRKEKRETGVGRN
jgi:hypothetical protein